MPNALTNLRLRSLDSNKPRVDLVRDGKEPAVPGPLVNAAELRDKVSKLSSDEIVGVIEGVQQALKDAAEQVREDDRGLAEIFDDGVEYMSRIIADRGQDGDGVEEIQESLRVLEDARAISRKNVEMIRAAKAALTAVGEIASRTDTMREAVSVSEEHEFGEFESGKPYVKVWCTFALAGMSKNIDEHGRKRYYSAESMKRMVKRGEYDNVPFYPYHHSMKELREYPDGIRSRIEGRTGPPAERPKEKAVWNPDIGTEGGVQGWLYITKASAVEQIRVDTAAGFSIGQILQLSHDARVNPMHVKIKKTDTGNVLDVREWRVASIDGATQAALGGATLRQVAARNDAGEDPMSDIAKETARLQARAEKINEEVALAETLGVGDKADAFRRWAESIDDRPSIGDIKAKVAGLTKPVAPPPTSTIAQEADTTEIVTGGHSREERLRAGLIGWWDVLGLVKDENGRPYNRSAEAFGSFQEFLRSAHASVGSSLKITDSNAMAALGTTAIYDTARAKVEDRAVETHWSTSEERLTEAYERSAGDSVKYREALADATDERFAEATVSAGIPQIAGDVKHLVGLAAADVEENGGHPGIFPPIPLVVSQRVVSDSIGETWRFVRYQQLGAGEAAAVAEGGGYSPGSDPADEEESATVPSKYGFYVDISIEAMSRDPLGLLRRMPTIIGQALGARKYRLAYNVVTANPTLADGNAVVSAAHGNHTAGAFSYANVTARIEGMQEVVSFTTGAGANRIHQPMVPRHLVVPSALSSTAKELFTHDTEPTTANRAASAVVNPGTPALSIWTLPLFDNASPANADDWFLVADNGDKQAEVVWSGQPEPRIFEAASDENGVMLSNDLHRYKGRMFYGIVPLDWRPFAGGIVP